MLEANIAYLTASGDPGVQPYIAALQQVSDYRWENGGRQAAAMADRATWELVKAGVAPLDTATAGYRMFINGEYNWENGLTLGGSVLGGVAGAGGKFISRVGSAGAHGPSGRVYSVAFESQLAATSYPGVSRARHFQEANESLLRAIETDAEFASMMGGLGVNLQRTRTGLAPRSSPKGWTWHHDQAPGTLQLVPRWQHRPGSIFQGALHPGGRGGYSIWGK